MSSPAEDAKNFKNHIMMGDDCDLWISKKTKSRVYKWVKLDEEDIISQLPLNPKFEYKEFLDFFEELEIPNTMFHYHDAFLLNKLEEELEEEEESIDATDLYLYDDNGDFYRNESDEYIEDLFDSNPDTENIFMITDADIAKAITGSGTLEVHGMSKLSKRIDKKAILKSLRSAFKDYDIRVPAGFIDNESVRFKIKLESM